MAIYKTIGTIASKGELKCGEGKNGRWQRMSLTLDVDERNVVTKQVIGVIGTLTQLKVGDKVEAAWTLYAREWQGKWYNNVDLVKIKSQEETKQDAPVPAAPAPQQAQIQFNQPQESLNPADHPDDLPF